MDKPFGRVRALNTADKLADAKITNNDGSTQVLVKSDAPRADLEAVAAAVSAMATAYDSLPTDGSTATANHPAVRLSALVTFDQLDTIIIRWALTSIRRK